MIPADLGIDLSVLSRLEGGQGHAVIGNEDRAADNAHSRDFRVFFATSIKARSFGAKEARRG